MCGITTNILALLISLCFTSKKVYLLGGTHVLWVRAVTLRRLDPFTFTHPLDLVLISTRYYYSFILVHVESNELVSVSCGSCIAHPLPHRQRHCVKPAILRSEEHTSELQSLMRT